MKLVSTVVAEEYGKGDFTEYRIPAITVMDNGIVVTAFESRRGAGDDWSEVWITIRRSTDGGRSFEVPIYPHLKISDPIAQEVVTWNNPVLIADRELLHLLFCSDYSRVWYCRSTDSGETFSEPVEITECFHKFPARWNVCAVGPGHGIAAADGRLVVPIWIAQGEVRLDLDPSGRIKRHSPSRAGCIISDDRGISWKAGFLTDGIENANETAVVQLDDGRFLFNFRNTRFENCRVLGLAEPSLKSLSKVWSETALPDPRCMGGMTGFEGKLFFVNCASSDRLYGWGGRRINLMISESSKEGENWIPVQLVDEFGGYADIASDAGGLYVFYEQVGSKGTEIRQLLLKRFAY